MASKYIPTTEITKLDELLLTVLALSQEGYNGVISNAIPQRLMYTWRQARQHDMVFSDGNGLYVVEYGCAEIDEKFGAAPFTKKKVSR